MQIVDLSHYQFVRVSGADAIAFLQGQVSCNMQLLSSRRSLSGALCNLKGRVIADFRVLRRGEDCLLQTAPELAQLIVDTLAKYAVFSKVELQVLEKLPLILGCSGTDAAGLLAEKFGEVPAQDDGVTESAAISIIKIPGVVDRFELWCPDEEKSGNLQSDPDMTVNAPWSSWLYEDICAGLVHIDAAHAGQYTPQLLNYDLSGVIDFKKGCYTGQEVVARMYYRGSPKKRTYLLRSATEIASASGVLQHIDGKQKPAELLAFANGIAEENPHSLLLTILDTQAVDRNALFTLSDQADLALQLLPLAYGEQTQIGT